MAAPKYIIAKAERLGKALDLVAQLAQELEDYADSKIGYELANDFFHNCSLDNPYEFNLAETIEALNEIAEN